MTKLSSPTAVVTQPAQPLSGADKMDAYFDAVSETFAQKLQDVLPKITAGAHRRLAIRNYVRFAARVSSRWAMTSAEETEFKKTTTYQTLESERKKIFKKFAQQNKGYSLRAHSQARSLETQIRFWNGNPTVKSIGKDFETKALNETGRKSYPDVPTDADVTKFKKWLKSIVKLSGSPTHATPGLSSHGRIRALDFTVWKGSARITGTKTATAKSVWDKPGWTTKLKDAIEAVSSNWDGPLKKPYEPWHWTFTGE